MAPLVPMDVAATPNEERRKVLGCSHLSVVWLRHVNTWRPASSCDISSRKHYYLRHALPTYHRKRTSFGGWLSIPVRAERGQLLVLALSPDYEIRKTPHILHFAMLSCVKDICKMRQPIPWGNLKSWSRLQKRPQVDSLTYFKSHMPYRPCSADTLDVKSCQSHNKIDGYHADLSCWLSATTLLQYFRLCTSTMPQLFDQLFFRTLVQSTLPSTEMVRYLHSTGRQISRKYAMCLP